MNSPWVKVEIELAFRLKQRRHILCATLDSTPPQTLHRKLRKVLAIDFTTDAVGSYYALAQAFAT